EEASFGETNESVSKKTLAALDAGPQSHANTPTPGSSRRRSHRCRLLLSPSASSEHRFVSQFRVSRLPPFLDPETLDRSRRRSVTVNRSMHGKLRRKTRSRLCLYASSNFPQTADKGCPSHTHNGADGISDQCISE